MVVLTVLNLRTLVPVILVKYPPPPSTTIVPLLIEAEISFDARKVNTSPTVLFLLKFIVDISAYASLYALREYVPLPSPISPSVVVPVTV